MLFFTISCYPPFKGDDMKETFNNGKFIQLQKQSIVNLINSTKDRIYLEIGGKYFDDLHASRVLVGYDPENKRNIINSLDCDKEFILCVSARSITKKKKRRDNKLLYIDECYRMIELLKKDNYKVSVVITMYKETPTITKFKETLSKSNIPIYKNYTIEDYPKIDEDAAYRQFLKNDFVRCYSKLVCVIAPGPNSGKFSTCISQIINEKENKKSAIYRKIETFLVPELSLDHPINLACSAAMADISSDDVVDERYYREYGKMMSVDSRDLQAFEILYPMVKDNDINIKALSDTFINNIYSCITDLEAAKSHAVKEINRRYKDAVSQYKSGKLSAIEYKEIVRIKNLSTNGRVLSKTEVDALFHKTIEYWGFDVQSNTFIEELAELIKAMAKYKREGCEKAPGEIKYNLLEEIADVHNMLYQMEIYFSEDKIAKIRAEKAYRTKRLLEKEMLEDKLNKGE